MMLKATISFYAGIAFLVILACLHFLKPEISPMWRMISEYEIGKFGFLMSIAFFCWGMGFLLLTSEMWKMLNTIGGIMGKWWLLIISIALFGAGIFTTQPITDIVRTTTDRLHALCGFLMIFTFPFAATLIGISISQNESFKTKKIAIGGFTLLVWIGFIVFFLSLVLYLPKDRKFSENTFIGIPNRFLVLTYTIWLLFFSKQMQRLKYEKHLSSIAVF